MSHPVDFATKKIERRKNFCVGPVMYDNTCQFSGVWHLGSPIYRLVWPQRESNPVPPHQDLFTEYPL